MKKLLGIVLALALVLTTVSAMAMVDIPLDNGGLKMETTPDIKIVRNGNTVTVSGKSVEEMSQDRDIGSITTTDGKGSGKRYAFAKQEDGTWSVQLDKDQYVVRGNVGNDTMGVSLDQNLEVTSYYEYETGNEYDKTGAATWVCYNTGNGEIRAAYDTASGKLLSTNVSVIADDKDQYRNYGIRYDATGKILWAHFSAWDGAESTRDYDWDTAKECWVDSNNKPVYDEDLPDVKAMKAPAVREYAVMTPELTMEEAGVKLPELKKIEYTIAKDGVLTVSDLCREITVSFKGTDEDGKTVSYGDYMHYSSEKNGWVLDDYKGGELTIDAFMEAHGLDSYKVTITDLDGNEVCYETDGSFNSFFISGDGAYYTVDNEGKVYVSYQDRDEPNLVFDTDGNLEKYSYYNEANEYVTFNMDGEVVGLRTVVDSVTYIYTAEDGWEKYDAEKGEYVACDAPEGIDMDDYEPLLVVKEEEEPKIEYTWYAHNTVCVAGLCLRDEYPGLTSKWYNFVPVDLTQDGVYNYTLVASNLFYIGNATVVVDNGTVTVGYSMARGEVYPEEECLQWFTSVDQMTGEYLEAPTGEFKFGEPVSIADDLGGADVGLLFICNRVTYRQPYDYEGGMLVRYWKNLDQWKAFRQDLYGLLDKIEK